MQFLFKIQIKTTIHGEICITPHINPRPISALGPTALGLILESRIDIGCDRNFAMHYSRYILCDRIKASHDPETNSY